MATIVETKTEDNVAETTYALVTTTNNGDMILNIFSHVSNCTWIIDSGAIDHMIFDSKHISYLKSFS